MAAPSLVLVPPTPFELSFPGQSPASSAPSTPELTQSTIDHERSSSETSIPSIYSMYRDQRGSWSASPRNSDDVQTPVATKELAPRDSFHSARSKSGTSTYYDAASRPSTRVEVLRASVSPNGSQRTSYQDARPPSSHDSSLAYINGDPADDEWGSIGQTFMDNVVPAPYFSPDSEATQSSPPRSTRTSRPPSQNRNSEHLNGSSRISTPPPRSFSRPSSSHNGDTSSPLARPKSQTPSPRPVSQALLTPETPPTTPPKPSRALRSRSKSPMSSPDSHRSPVPSEGEDAESFHVRSTYAQLDMIGVKGDGYEEGVERTRARIGMSRTSELRAEASLADDNEKNRELTPKEIETLASLDRYGFFSIPSHDRLILLPVSPLQKPLTRVASVTSNASASAATLTRVPSPAIPAKELSRIAKWNRMLEPLRRDIGGNIEIWAVKASKEHKLRERTYKGVPDRWRAAAWELFTANYSKTGKRELEKWAEEYRESLDKASSYDVQIDLDVPRTISGHIMFRTRYGSGQRSLFHVLHSFSLRCPDCGYCQGMGPIAATLLCYFDPERAYASLIRLHDAYAMHSIFQPGFPGLLESIYVQERIMQEMMPGVYEAFKRHMISTTSYATKWYITLFANSVPFQTQLRLWDVFLLEGYDIFVVVAISIVWVYKDHITSSSANFETVLSLLSSFFVPESDDALLAWISKVLDDKKLRTNMTRWREEWKQLVATGQDSKALL